MSFCVGTFDPRAVFRRWDGSGPDMLETSPLVDKELLLVDWPDGSVTEDVAIVEDGTAMIATKVRGLRVRVRLRGGPMVRRAPRNPEDVDEIPVRAPSRLTVEEEVTG